MVNYLRNILLFVLLFVLFGVYMFVFSESGILERREVKKKNEKLSNQIKDLKLKNIELSHLYNKYKDGLVADKDLLMWGYLPFDKSLIFVDNSNRLLHKNEKKYETKKSKIEITHLRIIWVVLSVLIILLYFSKRSDMTDE